MDWVVLGWIGFYWVELGSFELDWVELSRVSNEYGSVELSLVGLNTLSWVGYREVELSRVKLCKGILQGLFKVGLRKFLTLQDHGLSWCGPKSAVILKILEGQSLHVTQNLEGLYLCVKHTQYIYWNASKTYG